MQDQEIIIITAARPGLWFREKLTPSALKRWLGEKFVGDYASSMEKLRQIDDAIYEWVQDITTLNKQLREKTRRPGIMTDNAVADYAVLLGAINKRFKKIEEAGNVLEKSNEKYLEQFEDSIDVEVPEGSVYQLSEEEKKQIQEMQAASDGLATQAGIWEDLKKKWVSRKMESEFFKTRRKDILKLTEKIDKLVEFLTDKISDLNKARASGNIGNYINTLSEIGKRQQAFETEFVTVYNQHMKGPVESLLSAKQPSQPVQFEEPVKLEEPKKTEEVSEWPKLELDKPTVPSLPQAPVMFQEPEIEVEEVPQLPEAVETKEEIQEEPKKPAKKAPAKKKSTKKAPTKKDPVKKTPAKKKPDTEAEVAEKKESFVGMLETLLKEGDNLTAAMLISKYSEEIEESDPETSIQLLSVAAELINEK